MLPCRHILFFPSDFELLENLRMLVNAVLGRQRTGKEGWLGASVDVWPVAVIPHWFAWPFVFSYCRNNFLFKAFHGKGARRVNMSVLNCASQKCLSWGENFVLGNLTDLQVALFLHTVIFQDYWKIVLKCLLYLICLG